MIATVCRILAARTRRHRLTSEVVLMSGGEKLLLAPSRIGGGGARVTLSGSLTLAPTGLLASNQSSKGSSRESLTTAPAVTRRFGITRGSEASVQATRL